MDVMSGQGAKMQELYQERILELARSSKHSKPIDNPTHRAEKNNAICGDKVIINATIRDNTVYDAHLIVRGCALCEAGAGIWKETAVGKELNELNLLRDELDNFLKNNESLSTKEFACFEPLKKIRNRIDCVMLSFEAATDFNAINSD